MTPLELAEALLACLCGELTGTIAGLPCQCCIRPGGGLPPMDACCNCNDGTGQASVQIQEIFPTERFPSRGVQSVENACGVFTWAVELQVVVYRCVSCADDTGFPSCDELTADARKLASDAEAIRRAITCCEWHQEHRIIPGSWKPVAPAGCCAGGVMTVLVHLV